MDALKVKIYRRSLLVVILLTIASSLFFIDYDEDKTEKSGTRNVVSTEIKSENMVLPCGFPVGIYLETDGVMVISCGKVQGMDGLVYEPALDIVKAGDYVVSVNGIDVSSKSQLLFLINKYGKDTITVGIRRNGQNMEVQITPVRTGYSEYKIGVWVRDDTQGIGTMTFVTADDRFGALGHGISDIDTGELLASDTGLLYNARIWGIKKGSNGTPGGLCGTINYEEENIIGEIDNNTKIGIFGSIDTKYIEERFKLSYVEVGTSQEIKKGKAYIRTMVSGEIKDYEIEITAVNRDKENNSRQISLKVTDKRLINITNGIVQGMSGSPILQEGKIIGAVTHVLVDDPTRGYGIFIENMLEHN